MTPAPQDDAPSRANGDSAPTGPVSDPTSAVLDLREAASVRRYAPGEVLGDRYTIVEEIGSGGMGVVYKAVDRRLGQPVALKLLRPRSMTDAGIARFRRELALAQHVSHANVCRLHDLGDEDGVLYITMQHVEGQRLDHLILAMGHLSPKQTLALARQLCAGLEAIHAQGIVHRDLKPSNIMVDRSGHLYIMDFGLAVRPGGEERVTSTGAVLGTLAYLSPEQARGRPVTPQSDIYALGLILYEMLTGRCPPGDNNSLPLALREASERCPPPSSLEPDVPASLTEIVMGCLERESARRLASAAAVAARLDLAQADITASFDNRRKSAALTASRLPLRASRPWRSRWAIGGITLVLLAVVGLVRFRGRHADPLAVSGKPIGLAIMPLRFSGPDDQAYLKDLLPLVLTESLRRSTDLQMTSFASARTLGPGADIDSVGAQLGVAAALYGDLTSSGNELELSLRLLRPNTRQTVWTTTVRGDVNGIVPRTEQAVAEMARAMDAHGSAEAPKTSTARDAKALALYAEGRTLLEGWDVQRNYQRAADALTRALGVDERFPEAHAALAIALWAQYGQTHDTSLVERALGEAQRAVELQPALPETQLALGIVQLGMGRSVEATATFEKAQRLAPGDDSISRHIAVAAGDLGRAEEADRLFDRAIELRPRYWENHYAKAIYCLKQGRLDDAKGLLKKVIELRPDSDIGYSNLGGLYILTGQPEAAEPLLAAALKIASSTRAHSNLGFVYYATGRFQEAAQEFQAAITGDAQAGDHGNLGDAYRQLHRDREARAAYQRAIDLAEAHLRVNPSDAEYRSAVSMWLAGSGRCRPAHARAAEAVKAQPQNPMILYYASQAAAVCGENDLALEYATKAAHAGGVADMRTNPDIVPVLRASASGRQLLEAR